MQRYQQQQSTGRSSSWSGPAATHRIQAVSALAAVLSNAETAVLEGQGHGALMLAPDLVARAITDFLLRAG
jgi:pimeloyl-ACP methyl ester carboxylesterase